MGKLIVLEGIDGSGKSAQYRRLTARFKREGMDYRTNGQFITIYHQRAHVTLDIDSAHIRANGVIPYDMSHFGGHPRLRA